MIVKAEQLPDFKTVGTWRW